GLDLHHRVAQRHSPALGGLYWLRLRRGAVGHNCELEMDRAGLPTLDAAAQHSDVAGGVSLQACPDRRFMTFPGRRINHERPKPVYENHGPSDHSKHSVALSFHYFHSLGTGPKASEMIKEGRSLKKGLCLLAVAMLGAGLVAPAYSQNASSVAAPVQAGTGEVRVAAFLAPPSVMQQNGSLTGFSVDLWSAIAARLKLKTSYQIMPDVSHLEEAMRSKSADLTLSLFITSARDEDFDFSIPTLQAGLQIMVRDTGEKAQTASPLWDMLRLIFSQTTAEWLGM